MLIIKEKTYFTTTKKKFCLSLHHNGVNSYLFVDGKEIVKFKAKDSKIVASPLCSGNFSTDWSTDNMKKTGLDGYVYEFNVDYNKLNYSETIPYIHKYLMLKYSIKQNKMLKFIKKVFFLELTILSNFINVTPLNCISMKNQECKVRPEIINVHSNEPIFYPFSIKTNKCSGSCNNINDPYAKICIPDVIKDLNVKVFNLMSRTNETRHIKWHETCKCKCRLDASVCNNKQRWNNDKCRCECKELINKDVCDKGYIWNLSNCKSECDKSCDFGEYLDFENCKCRKRLVHKLIEECNENIEEISLIKINSAKYKSNSCILYIVLFSIRFTINIGIATYFIYYKYINHNKKIFLNMIMFIKGNIINNNIKW